MGIQKDNSGDSCGGQVRTIMGGGRGTSYKGIIIPTVAQARRGWIQEIRVDTHHWM